MFESVKSTRAHSVYRRSLLYETVRRHSKVVK